MVLTRISYALETLFSLRPNWLPPVSVDQGQPLQVEGHTFRKRLNTSKQPHTLVCIDLRNASDSVQHGAIIEAPHTAPLRVRALKFIKAFPMDRTLPMFVPGGDPERRHGNKIGVPQGSILYLRLFNLVITGLGRHLDTVQDLRFAIYADDITLWTTTRAITTSLTNNGRVRTPTTPRTPSSRKWACPRTRRRLNTSSCTAICRTKHILNTTSEVNISA